ncbi:MAG: Stk1 family PASTA domain-containing Ser/Thr kinase [Microbacteriaceae bacterium]|nr:Stk1 family PASTA domain-containing Ser/Thr kinase [Microbacteriaceae bacterium]
MVDSGFLFARRYRPEALIGRGGMANVYVGTDTRLQRRVAIKALRPEVAADAESRNRFQREAHSVSAMGHPNIVRVYDAGEEFIPAVSVDIPIPYIVMEYIDGKILRKLMDAGPFEPKVAVHIALGILDALAESHRAGIIHRDIKPGNIMITQSGLVKVCDFGIAKAIEDPTNDPSAIVGTAQYFSPEQAKGEMIDGRSDLYSTAVVLFEMVTGSPLFTGDTSVSIAFQHVTQTAPRARSRRPELSPELDMIIARGLEKDRSARFHSASDFAAALRSVTKLVGQGRAGRATTPPAAAPVPVSAGDSIAVGHKPRPTAIESSSATHSERAETNMDLNDLRPLLNSDTPPKASLVRWVLLGAAGLLTVASVVVGMMYFVLTLNTGQTLGGLSISMPDVTGVSFDTAETQLAELGLTVVRRVESSDTVPKGSVVSTSPESGVNLAEGEIVTVVESSGAPLIAVPSVNLLAQAKAVSALENAGFVIGKITKGFSPTAKLGVVVGSDPEEGSRLPAGTLVNIIVSNGKVKIPDVVGMSVGKALRLLQGSSLQLDVTVVPDSSCGGQEIGSQSLKGEAPQQSEVTVVYCAAK